MARKSRRTGHPESRIARRGRDFSREQFMIGSRRGTRPRRYSGRTADALAQGADEGRGKPRKSWGSRTRAWIPGCPNGGTQQARACYPLCGRQPGELKHLSTPRRGNQTETPPVAASERGPAQTGARVKRAGAAAPGLRMRRPGPARPGRSHKARARRKTHGKARGTGLEPRTRRHVPAGRSPEYRRARGTRREAGGTAPQG